MVYFRGIMKLRQTLFAALSLAVFLIPWILTDLRPEWKVTNYAPGLAIILGVLCTACFGNPLAGFTQKAVSPLLGATIVGMGCSMDLIHVLKTGGSGFAYTVVGIAAAIGFGLWLGRRLRMETNTTLLVSIGTGICGGSAIAAAAPVIRAKSHEIALATATVFILNGVALLIFPPIGHLLGFDQTQFGTWAALAIHDTSSVVGASLAYGEQALDVGVTVKLARALWIIPVALCLSVWMGMRPDAEAPADGKRRIKVKVPWFIPGFLIAAAIVTFVPPMLGDAGSALVSTGHFLKKLSKYLMILTLFWVGANLSLSKLKEVGIQPFVHGVVLWVVLGSVWCAAIAFGWIARHEITDEEIPLPAEIPAEVSGAQPSAPAAAPAAAVPAEMRK